ncbi:MAG: restriction endonuclease subunit S [Burkholderiaceae bacterium]|nr:restriction endonuclease subunit S [Burkholderiaceae bacterium]
MSFPRYPEYKDSGVEWLGEVPGHWEVISIKWLSPVRRGASPRPIDDPKYFDAEGEFSWVRIADVSACDGVLTETTQQLSELGSSLSVKVAPGDLFVSIAGTVGKPCLSAIKACIHDGFVYFPTLQIDPKFLYRVFEGGTCYGGLGKWGTQLNLNTDTIGSIRVALPPADELEKVLAFLDRETAKIDALVAEQRRLMALLKEKRQAVISHAVTRGLNPHAPLKPSGIEWLGDVPTHWEVKKIKFVTANVKAGPFGSALTKDVYVSAGYRVYGQEQVIPNDFTLGDYFITPAKYDELSQYNVIPGDILISCVGTFGKIAIVPANIEPGIINPRLIRLRCTPAIKAEYLVEVMRSNVTFEQFSSFTRGGTMDVINIGTLNEIYLALPPGEEQLNLLSFIKREIAKFDSLTTEAQRAIDLLQERRTALISAAVTGQIDVRGAA